jgi:hypothetical protein
LTADTAIKISTPGTVTIGDMTNLTSGALKAGAPAFNVNGQLLVNTNIATAGTTTVTGANVLIGTGNSFTNVGSKMNITATTGNISMGQGNTFLVRGGNLAILAKGTVSGDTGNSFLADGISGTPTGGVEVGSGLTAGTLSKTFAKPTTTVPTLGANVTVTQINPGAIVLNPASGGGTVDISSTAATTVTLNRGVIVFDAVGVGSSVNLGSATFQVHSSQPVAFNTVIENDAPECIVYTDIDE